MTPSQPYIVRALYEWILENECTPHVLVNALADNVEVPQQFVKDGQIVLNVSPVAVKDLLLTNDAIQFNGRFGGMPMGIYVPMTAVMGIYAKENGRGMMFDMDKEPQPEPPSPKGSRPKGLAASEKKSGKKDQALSRIKPGLRVVK
ncbi:MAG: ClpXP protease specificity-enhancing factor [Pseudomonadales bacterium]